MRPIPNSELGNSTMKILNKKYCYLIFLGLCAVLGMISIIVLILTKHSDDLAVNNPNAVVSKEVNPPLRRDFEDLNKDGWTQTQREPGIPVEWGEIHAHKVSYNETNGTISIEASYETFVDYWQIGLDQIFELKKIEDIQFLYDEIEDQIEFFVGNGPALLRLPPPVRNNGDKFSIMVFSNRDWYLWPYDRYSSEIYALLPGRYDGHPLGTVKFSGHIDPESALPMFYEGQPPLEEVRPLTMAARLPMTFDAPEGYIMYFDFDTLGTGQDIIPFWTISIRQTLKYPQYGFVCFAILYILVLVIVAWRAVNYASSLEVAGVLLTMIFGLNLVAEVIHEPKTAMLTMVDVLRFIVIVFGFLIVAISLVMSAKARSQDV